MVRFRVNWGSVWNGNGDFNSSICGKHQPSIHPSIQHVIIEQQPTLNNNPSQGPTKIKIKCTSLLFICIHLKHRLLAQKQASDKENSLFSFIMLNWWLTVIWDNCISMQLCFGCRESGAPLHPDRWYWVESTIHPVIIICKL